MASPKCTGRGDSGDHCCYIGGKVCEFLFTDRGGTPRCALFSQWGSLETVLEWRQAPVGEWFAANNPGAVCGDWPQNLPAVMASSSGLCCWGSD